MAIEKNADRLKVAHSILLALIGSPVLYYDGETGLGDNIELDDRNAGFPAAESDRVYAPLIADPVDLFNPTGVVRSPQLSIECYGYRWYKLARL